MESLGDMRIGVTAEAVDEAASQALPGTGIILDRKGTDIARYAALFGIHSCVIGRIYLSHSPRGIHARPPNNDDLFLSFFPSF